MLKVRDVGSILQYVESYLASNRPHLVDRRVDCSAHKRYRQKKTGLNNIELFGDWIVKNKSR